MVLFLQNGSPHRTCCSQLYSFLNRILKQELPLLHPFCSTILLKFPGPYGHELCDFALQNQYGSHAFLSISKRLDNDDICGIGCTGTTVYPASSQGHGVLSFLSFSVHFSIEKSVAVGYVLRSLVSPKSKMCSLRISVSFRKTCTVVSCE